jgi:hypothetical protein
MVPLVLRLSTSLKAVAQFLCAFAQPAIPSRSGYLLLSAMINVPTPYFKLYLEIRELELMSFTYWRFI